MAWTSARVRDGSEGSLSSPPKYRTAAAKAIRPLTALIRTDRAISFTAPCYQTSLRAGRAARRLRVSWHRRWGELIFGSVAAPSVRALHKAIFLRETKVTDPQDAAEKQKLQTVSRGCFIVGLLSTIPLIIGFLWALHRGNQHKEPVVLETSDSDVDMHFLRPSETSTRVEVSNVDLAAELDAAEKTTLQRLIGHCLFVGLLATIPLMLGFLWFLLFGVNM